VPGFVEVGTRTATARATHTSGAVGSTPAVRGKAIRLVPAAALSAKDEP
jgi:hypothetical protein